ncbi:hypothetical protein [Lentilactobacillus laojiaonis]|uniref:hypothetical protein n=1 Tax=Lentilactobacillus laojiaonis TaxID=2883998 RepID=UPI001D0A8F8B|nr:hypothetical protein [Lentilactobacillus laojiaonis]UDM31673.1 hypothetical protein LHL71_03770 [Lentilactobacillus laojiaonis]
MITLNINGNLGNQQITLSDNSVGQLSGVRVFSSFTSGRDVVQWTFVTIGNVHEGFVYAGDFAEGQEISSINGNTIYKVHFVK